MVREYIIYADAIAGESKVTLVLGFEEGETPVEAFETLKATEQWWKLRETLADGALKIREVGELNYAFVRLGEIDVGEEISCP